MNRILVAKELTAIARSLTATQASEKSIKAAQGRFEKAVEVLEDCLAHWHATPYDENEQEGEAISRQSLVGLCKKISRMYPLW